MGSRPFKDWWKVVQCSKAWVLDTSWHILTHPLLRRSFRSLQIFVWHRWLLAVVSLQPQVVARGSKSLHPGLQEGHWWCRLVQGTSTVWTDGQTSKSKLRPYYSQEKSTNMSKHSKRLTIQCDQCKVLCGRSCRCTISVHHTNRCFFSHWNMDEMGWSRTKWDGVGQRWWNFSTGRTDMHSWCDRALLWQRSCKENYRHPRWQKFSEKTLKALSNFIEHLNTYIIWAFHVHPCALVALAGLSETAPQCIEGKGGSRAFQGSDFPQGRPVELPTKKHPHWIFTYDARKFSRIFSW